MLMGFRNHATHLSLVNLFVMLISAALLTACYGSEPLRDQVEARIPESGCPNVSGTYVLYGDPLPGMPSYFRIRRGGLALDEMLGLDLNVPEKERLATVDFRQSDTLEVIARGEFGVLSRKYEWRPGDQVLCVTSTLAIRKIRESQGEDGKVTMEIVDTLWLADDGALLVRVEIHGRGRALFLIPWRWHEEYGARFKRVQGQAS